jgi:predicted porin
MKRISLVALTAVAGLFSSNVLAADLGGDCCADLEERVAELEATTARKGNRKVSLTIYGQITTAVMFWDARRGDGNTQTSTPIVGAWSEDNVYIVDPQTSGSRFGFKGKASINGEWSAGYQFEFQWQAQDATKVRKDNDDLGDLPEFRQAHWWLKSKNFGKVRVGLADTANSGIAEIDVSITSIADAMSSSQAGGSIIRRDIGGPGGQNFEYNRQNVIRYDTPTFGGFYASTSYGEDDLWDVAFRYAGEHMGFKMAGGIAYGRRTDCGFALADGTYATSCGNRNGLNGGQPEEVAVETLNGGISILHVGTGLFYTGSAGEQQAVDTVTCAGKQHNGGNCENDWFWFSKAGIERKYLALGKTAVFGMGGEQHDGVDRAWQMWGLGAVQKIDAAAMDLYVSYRSYDVDTGYGIDQADGDFDTVVAGGRIKF